MQLEIWLPMWLAGGPGSTVEVKVPVYLYGVQSSVTSFIALYRSTDEVDQVLQLRKYVYASSYQGDVAQ